MAIRHREQTLTKDVVFTPGGPRAREKVHVVEAAKDLVVPPGGPRYRTRVHRVEAGQEVRFLADQGIRLRQADTPGPPDQANWITYAGWTNPTGRPITRFLSTWTVPRVPPTPVSQLIYLFNGIEPADGKVIV